MQERVAIWKAAFEGDGQSVMSTLTNFAWNYAAFQTFVAIAQAAPTDEDGQSRLNPLMFQLASTGFWGWAFPAFRRLLDTGPLHGANGVCSLRAIVRDARSVRHRITRRVYVEVIGEAPYDYLELRRQQDEFMRGLGEGIHAIPRRLTPEISEYRHAEFDWLSAVDPADRSPDDLIQDAVFDRLEARLASLDHIYEHATVHYAHAATQASRQGRGLQGFNLAEANAALRELTEVATFVGRWFCNGSAGPILPVAQDFDPFAYLDQPLFTGDVGELQATWDAFETESQAWREIENERL